MAEVGINLEYETLIHNSPHLPAISGNVATALYLSGIYDAVHRKRFSYLGMFVGRHRSGKSVSAITLASVLDPTFLENLEKRVVYHPDQFMDAVTQLADTNTIGGVIVWDEAGVGLPAREWYDISNRSISFVLQVFGWLRPIVFFVSQDISYIDASARRLFQAFYDMQRPSNDYTNMWAYDIVHNRRTGKMYFYAPRVRVILGGGIAMRYVLRRIKIMRPPIDLIQRYNDYSEPWKKKITKEMQARIEHFKDDSIPKKKMTTDEIIRYVVEHYRDYLTSRASPEMPRLSDELIQLDFNIPGKLARAIKLRAEQLILRRLKKNKKRVMRDGS